MSAPFGVVAPEAGRAGRARLAQHPAAGRVRGGPRRRERIGVVSAATCTVPTPTSASQRTPRRGRAPAPSAPSAPGRTEIRPRCAPSGSAGGVRSPARHRPRGASASTSARDAFEQHATCVVPSHAMHDGPEDAARTLERVERRSRAPRGRPGRGWHRSVTWTMHPERAERADEQPRQVVAGHVLHRRAAALHDPAVGGDEAHLEHAVAQRAVPEPPWPESPAASTPPTVAVGIARIERALLAVLAEHRGELGHRRAGADGDRQVGGVVGARCPTGPRTSTAVAGSAAPPTSHCVRAPTATTDVAAATRRERVDSSCEPRRSASHPRARRGPAGARRSGCPRGSTFVGVGAARRVERVAEAGLRVEVVGGEHQRHGVALLEPDAVLARQHAARGDARGEDLVAGAVAPAPRRPAPARRTRSAGAGCRRRRGTRS